MWQSKYKNYYKDSNDIIRGSKAVQYGKPFDGEYETKHFTPTTPSSHRPKTLKFNNIRSDPPEHALNEVSFSKMHTRLNTLYRLTSYNENEKMKNIMRIRELDEENSIHYKVYYFHYFYIKRNINFFSSFTFLRRRGMLVRLFRFNFCLFYDVVQVYFSILFTQCVEASKTIIRCQRHSIR